jgi:hypothetical protein
MTRHLTGRPQRRMLFKAVAGLLGSVCVGGPALGRSEITPQAFGATGRNAVDDTRAWNMAVMEASRTRRPVMASGTYALQVPSTSQWKWGLQENMPVHVAVQLRSGVEVFGNNAVILVAPTERAPTSMLEKHVLFGTGLNRRSDAVSDVTFDGLTFDFGQMGAIHPLTYAFGVTGVTRFRRRNLVFTSSGKAAGRGLLVENTVSREDSGLRHSNIIQGIYSRYERGVSMRNIEFDGFVEALDFDGPSWDVELSSLRFANGRGEGQCIDTAGGSNWRISDVVAQNTGPLLFIYAKGNAWRTYDQWLASGGRLTSDYVPPEDFLIRNVKGIRSGLVNHKGGHTALKGEALRIGNVRRPRGPGENFGPGPRNIVLEDIDLSDGGQIAVNDCTGLALRRIKMAGTLTASDATEGAALMLKRSTIKGGGVLSGTVSDVIIQNSTGMGVYAEAGPELSVERVSVTGYGSSSGPSNNAGIRLRKTPGAAIGARVTQVTISGGQRGGIDIDGADK